MTPEQLITICERFKLGQILDVIEAINTGFLHLIWRIKTTKGEFAIKQLNLDPKEKKSFLENIKIAESLAEKYKSREIPAVTALSWNNQPYCEIGGKTFMVFPWINGKPIESISISHQQARRIGQFLGKLHALNISSASFKPEYFEYKSTEWKELLEKGYENNAVWFNKLQKNLSHISLWNQCYKQAWSTLKSKTIISHRDLNLQNILWTNSEQFYVIDWEMMGAIHPTCELLDVALNWSGILRLHLIEGKFKSIISGYLDTGCKLPPNSERTAVYGCYGNWLHWLAFNLKRSLKENIEKSELKIALKQINSTLNSLNLLAADSNKIIRWMKEV